MPSEKNSPEKVEEFGNRHRLGGALDLLEGTLGLANS